MTEKMIKITTEKTDALPSLTDGILIAAMLNFLDWKVHCNKLESIADLSSNEKEKIEYFRRVSVLNDIILDSVLTTELREEILNKAYIKYPLLSKSYDPKYITIGCEYICGRSHSDEPDLVDEKGKRHNLSINVYMGKEEAVKATYVFHLREIKQ